MNDASDQQLLRDYTERRSEAAFAELVRRHVDFVYSAARRMVNDSQLAEDVTQGVFIALGQSARRLTDRAVLAGWLHRTTRNLAAKAVRTEVRRRAREQEAVAMNELVSPANEPAWEHIAPHLDVALDKLGDVDRDAVLLRYIEHKTAREVGQTLGLSEEAAQKRVSRALDKLRAHFARKGFAVSATVIGSLVMANAVQAAPASLATTVASASLAGAAGGGATTLTLKLMETIMAAKLKFTVAALIVAGAVATPVILSQKNGHSEEVEAILRHSEEKMASYKTWSADLTWKVPAKGAHGVGATTWRPTSPQDEPTRSKGRTFFQAPNLLRVETETTTDGRPGQLTIVRDANGVLWQELTGGTKPIRTRTDTAKAGDIPFVEDISKSFNPVEHMKFYRDNCRLIVQGTSHLGSQRMNVLEGTIKDSAMTNPSVATWAKMISKVRFYIGVDDGFMHRLEVYPANGDGRAEIEWHNLKFNEDLPASLFTFIAELDGVDVTDLTDARARAREQRCQNNLQQLGLALLNYADAHGGRLPDAKRWCDVLVEEQGVTRELFVCPERPGRGGYVLNLRAGADTKKWQEPRNLVLLFEGDRGWNATLGATVLPALPPHANKLGVVLADGSVKFVTLAEAKTLQWKPAPQ